MSTTPDSLLQRLQRQVESCVQQPGVVNDALALVEQRTNVKKIYIAYGILGVVGLWLMFGFGGQLVCNSIGFLYPAMRSIKALESDRKSDDTQWLMYWVVFSLFSVLEFFSDLLVSLIPFYWMIKCVFLVWLMSPLQGANTIYHKLILPYFSKHESAIDDFVKRGEERIAGLADKARDIATEQAYKKD